MVTNIRVRNDSLQLDNTEAWVPSSFFLLTILILLIFLDLLNTGILKIMELMETAI
jgi:hypothetical protein